MANDTLLLLLAAILFLALFILGVRDVDISEKRAKYAQALLTLLALGTTAYWFFLERKGMPHADVTQKLEVLPLGDDLVAVEAHIQIKNLGQRLLEINHVNSRLQAVRPDAYDYAGLNKKRGDEYWSALRPKGDEKQFLSAELRWPILRRYDNPVEHRIEPGETDLIVVTFLVSCSEYDWVRVASDVYNPSTTNSESTEEDMTDSGGVEGLAWKTRSFANLYEACSGTRGETDAE
jgi:hypothetical protein